MILIQKAGQIRHGLRKRLGEGRGVCYAKPNTSSPDIMLIKAHQKTYSVELQEGSRWWIWPPDIYGTLRWSPSTDLSVVEINDISSTHALVDQEGTPVRVISADADWIPKRMRGRLIAAE